MARIVLAECKLQDGAARLCGMFRTRMMQEVQIQEARRWAGLGVVKELITLEAADLSMKR